MPPQHADETYPPRPLEAVPFASQLAMIDALTARMPKNPPLGPTKYYHAQSQQNKYALAAVAAAAAVQHQQQQSYLIQQQQKQKYRQGQSYQSQAPGYSQQSLNQGQPGLNLGLQYLNQTFQPQSFHSHNQSQSQNQNQNLNQSLNYHQNHNHNLNHTLPPQVAQPTSSTLFDIDRSAMAKPADFSSNYLVFNDLNSSLSPKVGATSLYSNASQPLKQSTPMHSKLFDSIHSDPLNSPILLPPAGTVASKGNGSSTSSPPNLFLSTLGSSPLLGTAGPAAPSLLTSNANWSNNTTASLIWSNPTTGSAGNGSPMSSVNIW